MSSTHHRDLQGGRSPWQDLRVVLPPRARLRRDRDCDVLVVGAGISGALQADALSSVGLQVICCDRRQPLQGSTAASTALLLHETDTPLVQLEKQMGRDDAQRLWRRSFLALHALRDRAATLGIDANIEQQHSLYLQGNQLNAQGLRSEARARGRAGFEVTYMTSAQVESEYGIRRRAALRSGGSLVADPRALAAGFLRAAAARGAELLAPEEITTVVPRKSGVQATTLSGHTISARHLVFATGYELPHGVPAHGHRIVSTWVIATRPQRRAPWPEPVIIWEASETYLYLRTMADGRLLCGGGDEEIADATVRDALLARKTAWLQRRLSALVPQAENRIGHAWSGSFGASSLGLPTIGAVPGMRNCYAVLGYGGNGITFSMMAAQMLGNALSGAGDADLDLVAFRSRR
jgi:glycine/D-amino acid oxidase-like deaminating enzyme